MFFDRKVSKSSGIYYLEPGLYSSITDIVGAMNTLIQERHTESESCFTFKASGRTQKVEMYIANERSGLVNFNMDLKNISEVMLVKNSEWCW